MGVKLARVEIKNYRSIFEAPGHTTMKLDLSSGMNAFVGPNNVGKSNIIKALALALEEGGEGEFVLARDTPAQLQWARPTITLEFVVDAPSSPERTLLKRLEEYEQDALQGEKKKTLASKNRVRLRVQFTRSGRDDFFLTAAGSRRGSPELNEKALEQFRKVVRFILVRSGEDIQTFLTGRFRDILHNVLRESLATEVKTADEKRHDYQRDVSTSVFGSVAELVQREIGQLIPEIEEVTFEPRVLPIEETLATASISIRDTADTDLTGKGSGVRGTLLIAMLRYIAQHSKRSVVFAVEEPEAFLHPAAQSEIRDDLERLAERSDVTLLVTTHSPFVISRASAAQLFRVCKDSLGCTFVSETAAGDADARSITASLFSDSSIPDLLERVALTKTPGRAFVVVEGYTDKRYLEVAARLHGLDAIADAIEVVEAGGAKTAAVQAVLLRAANPGLPVLALLDYEPLTKSYIEMLRKTFDFPPEAAFTYREFLGRDDNRDVEAEALLPDALLASFVEKAGEDVVVSEKKKVAGAWAYGFNQLGKGQLAEYVDSSASIDDMSRFADLWRELDRRVTMVEAKPAPA